MVISINDIFCPEMKNAWSIRKMAKVLEKQGQIEPLQVKEIAPNLYETFEYDVHGIAIVLAAHYLQWTTLLIHVIEE